MALQSILHDPNISKFLDQIPQNQHIITLKQLIYIGIKIVSNSFDNNQKSQNIVSARQNKQNHRENQVKEKKTKRSTDDKFYKNIQNDKKFKKFKNHIPTLSNHSNKIQSTLLREISKIRLQLQSLTNKVYDHYFDENQPNQSDDSLNYNAQQQADYIESNGFNYPEDVPTFSPAKDKQLNSNSYASNPFLKQKNKFFIPEQNSRIENQSERRRSHEAKNTNSYPQQQQRCRAKSNVMHLDDTQIRQALYKDNQEESEPEKMHRKQKKSHSMIEKRHQQKKKDQQNYFYQLNLDKQNLKELQKFKESKHQPEDSYRDFVDQKPPAIDHFKKKAKSKIKYLVQRDRLRHQTKVDEENFKKGFEQYEYSANEMDEEEEEEEEESQEQQENQQETFSKEEQSLQNQAQNQQRSAQEYSKSPEAEYEREKERKVSNQNFGFYNSNQQSEQASRRESTFNNNQSFPEEKLSFKDNESSFSQFSQFSMSSSNSKRQVGKISRKRHD